MKKFLKVLLMLLLIVLCVSCGEEETPDDQPVEDVSTVAREYLKAVNITYADGDSASSVTKDITLVNGTAEGVTVAWTSDNEAVIAISGTVGKVTQSDEDVKVKITAKLTYKEVTLTKPFTLTVKSSGPAIVDVTKIEVYGASELEVNEEAQYVATVTPEDATDATITWSTSNANVITIDATTGSAVAIAVGTATITATSNQNNEVVGSVDVTVTEAVELSTVAAVNELAEGTVAKIRAAVVGVYAQGYMLYDETGYILYYLGSGATLNYVIGDYIEVCGTLGKYNDHVQFTSSAKAEKLGDGHTFSFTPATFDQATFDDFYGAIQYCKMVTFYGKVTSVSANYVNVAITGLENSGICVTYPTDGTLYEVDKEYEITGLALYAKEYSGVKYIYVMVTEAGELHTIKFDTDAEGLAVDDIIYSDYNKVELPEVYREGYYFIGWYDGDNAVEALTENKDYTLKASWVERVFDTIEFEANGGELVFANQLIIRNYNCTVGYVKKYDSFTLYKKGSATKAWASSYYHNLFLKEVEPGSNVYKVTFKAGSGTDIDGYIDGLTYDFDYILSSNANNAENDLLVELYKDANIMSYYFGFVVPENCPQVCNIKLLYSLERTKVSTTEFKYEVDEELPDVTKDYYDFVGWYDNAEFNGDPIANHEAGKTKYYAKFEATTYEIAYELGDSTTTATLKQTYTIEDEEIVLPTAAEMSKEDATFLGWFDNDQAAGTAITSIPKGSNGNKTLYACWAENAVKQLAVSAEDVAILNQITPTLIVKPEAKVGNYQLVGEGLAASYNDITYASGTVYATLSAAVLGAKENDIIYVMAGTYTDTVVISVANIKVIGPNYGVTGYGETRVEEANFTAQFTIAGDGVEVNGLKFTENAAVLFKASNIKLLNNYISTASVRIGSANRKGSVVGSDDAGVVLDNILIEGNYVNNTGSSAGYTTQIFSFNVVSNLYIKKNYFENSASAQGTAGTEMAMIYYPKENIEICENEFHVLSDFAIIRTGFTLCENLSLKINDNKFYSNGETTPAGMIYVAKLTGTQTFEFIGNLLTYTVDTPFRFQDLEGTVTIKYNAFLGKEYKVSYSDDSTWVDPKTATFIYENNYFKNGVSEEDTTGAKESTKYDTQEALNEAYAVIKGKEAEIVEYNITYDLGGGQCSATLVEKYNKNSDDIVLPAAEQMTVANGTFVGWFDNAEGTGEAITTIAKGSTGDKKFYAIWHIESVPTVTLPDNFAAILEVYKSFDIYVVAGVDQPFYLVNGVQCKLNETIFSDLTAAIKTLKADQDYKIFVCAGEYNITADASCELMPKGTNALTIVGPNALVSGRAERAAEAKIKIATQVSIYGKFTMEGVEVFGLGATKKSSNGNNFFYIKNDINSDITFNNCVMYGYRTAIYYVKPSTANTKASLTITNCSISEVGQFFVWGDTGSTLTNFVFNGNYVDLSTFGASNTDLTALIRMRASATSYIMNNYFEGVGTSAKLGGTFENSAADGSTMYIMYNTFKNIRKLTFVQSNAAAKPIVYNYNLYLDAEGAVQNETHSTAAGTAVTLDSKLCVSEEDRAAKYANYVQYGMPYAISYELNEGNTTGTLVDEYYKTENAIALPAADTMSKEGYTFVGWFDNADALGDAYTEIPANSEGTKKFYAIWMSNNNETLTFSEADIAALSQLDKCPDKIVNASAIMASYTVAADSQAALTGKTGYDATFTFNKNLYISLAAAIASAKDGEVIYVMAGSYAAAVTVNNSITIVGPNYNINGAAERKDEAIVSENLVINANNVVVNGLTITGNGSVKIYTNYVTVESCVINGAPSACGTNNRSGVITIDDASSNIIIRNNLIDPNATEIGTKSQYLTINNVTNLEFSGNTVKNTKAATLTATSYESAMWYRVSGDIVIKNNVFDFSNDNTVLNIGYYNTGVVSYIDILDNTFTTGSLTKSGGIRIRKIADGSIVNIMGNTLNVNIENGITVRTLSDADTNITVNVKYNVINTNGGLYCADIGSGSTTFNVEDNFFNGVNAGTTDIPNATAAVSLADADAVTTAYNAYKADKKSEIRYNLNGGACSVTLVKEFTAESDDIILPTAEAMTRSAYVFVGWMNTHTGEMITKIEKGTKADFISVKAVWHYTILTVDPTNEKYYATLADALDAAYDGDTIKIAAGSYEISALNKKVTIIGPNVNKAGNAADRAEEAKIKVTAAISLVKDLKLVGCELYGTSSYGKGFLISVDTLSSIVIDNCLIHDMKTVFDFEGVSSTTVQSTISVTNSKIYQIGQFFIWGEEKATLTTIVFNGNYIDLSTFGEILNANGSFIRSRSAATAYIMNNTFVGQGFSGYPGGTFENSATNGETMYIMYNVFKNNGKLTFIKSEAAAQPIVYNYNLYLDAADAVLAEPNATCAGTKATADTTVCISEEDRAAKYAEYVFTKDLTIKTTLNASIYGYSGYWTTETRAANLFLVDKATAASAGDTYAYAIRYGITYSAEKGCYVVDKIFTVGTEALSANTSDYVIMCGDNYTSLAGVQSLAVGDMIYTQADLAKLAAGEINVKLFVVAAAN